MATSTSPLDQLLGAAQTAAPPSQPSGSPLDQLLAAPAAPANAPEQDASNTRQMLVSGLTGMPTPNMTVADKESFERGKAAGAVSVPVVAGAVAGASVLPSAASALEAAAKAHPFVAHVIQKGLEAIGLGAGAETVREVSSKLVDKKK